MRDITQIANQVGSGANQVSAGAQALSQGTAQQKVSINGLVSIITDITAQIQNSTIRCGNATDLVDRATGYAAEADTKMEQLIVATKNIDQSSAQISSIIKTIEDIAFQTNILALNASVENRIKEVSRVIQTNSDAAEESAAGLSGRKNIASVMS